MPRRRDVQINRDARHPGRTVNEPAPEIAVDWAALGRSVLQEATGEAAEWRQPTPGDALAHNEREGKSAAEDG